MYVPGPGTTQRFFMILSAVFALSATIGCGGKTDDANDESDDSGTHSHDHHEGEDTDLPDDFDDSRTILSNDGVFTATYAPNPDPPPESVEFSVLITISDPDNSTVTLTGAEVTDVDSTMPSHGGHGMNVVPVVTDNGDGTWTAAPLKYHMPGYWVLHVEADINGETDRADFDISCCE